MIAAPYAVCFMDAPIKTHSARASLALPQYGNDPKASVERKAMRLFFNAPDYLFGQLGRGFGHQLATVVKLLADRGISPRKELPEK